MKRSSILMQIGGLAIAIIVVVQLVSVSVVILTPPPVPSRMSPIEMRDALARPDAALKSGWRRRESDAPPFDTSPKIGAILAASLANALGKPASDLRVRVESDLDPATMASITALTTGGGQEGRLSPIPEQDVASVVGLAVMTSGLELDALQAAMKQADGRWTVVESVSAGAFERWFTRLGVTLALSMLLITPLAWWAAQRVTRPVRALALAAKTADIDSLSANFDDAPVEIRAVAEALYEMHRRLSAQVQDRMRILTAVAHDLRTPLTGLRLRAETAPERDRMAADIRRMEAMISDVLTYSTPVVPAAGECLAVDDVVRDCVEYGRELGWRVSAVAASGATVNARRDRVQRVILNLMENAVRYGRRADLDVRIRGDRVVIDISDEGPGLTPDQIKQVFEPFVRLEQSRSLSTGGIGLGLTIARSLAAADGGDIELRPGPRRGLVAALAYPRAPHGDAVGTEG